MAEESISPENNSQGTEATTVDAGGSEQSTTSYMDGRFDSISALEQGITTSEKRYEDYRSMNDKRFGAFVGAPEDGYSFKEGYESEDQFDNLREWGKDNGLSNDAFQQLIDMSEAEDTASQEAFVAEQREALGKDADIRIQNVVDWAKANLGDDSMGALDDMVSTAAGIEMFEKIAKISAGTAPAQVAQPKTMVDRDTVKSMRFANDEFGNRRMSTDPQYRAKVEAMEAEFIHGGGKL